MTPAKPKSWTWMGWRVSPTRGPSDEGLFYWMASGRLGSERVKRTLGWCTEHGSRERLATLLDEYTRRRHGGARPNSGPKPVAGVARSEGALVRLTPDEVERFLAARPGSALATAVRDMALVGLAAVEQARETTPDSKNPTRAATRAKRAKPGGQP